MVRLAISLDPLRSLYSLAHLVHAAQQEDIDARIEVVVKSFGEHGVPFMWSVGPFAQPTDLGARLESHGLSHADELPGMAVDLQAINQDAPRPSGLATERVSDEQALRERVELIRVGFEMPEFASEAIIDVLTHMSLTDGSPFRSYLGKLDGEAVSSSVLFLESGVAGVHNVVALFGATTLDDVRKVLDEHPINTVIMGAGIYLEMRLRIVRHVFEASDST